MVSDLQNYSGALFKDSSTTANHSQPNQQQSTLASTKQQTNNNRPLLLDHDAKTKTNQTKAANSKKIKFEVIPKENISILLPKKKIVTSRKAQIN